MLLFFWKMFVILIICAGSTKGFFLCHNNFTTHNFTAQDCSCRSTEYYFYYVGKWIVNLMFSSLSVVCKSFLVIKQAQVCKISAKKIQAKTIQSNGQPKGCVDGLCFWMLYSTFASSTTLQAHMCGKMHVCSKSSTCIWVEFHLLVPS